MKRSEMLQSIKDIIRETCDVKKGPRLGVALKVLKAIEEAGMLPPSNSSEIILRSGFRGGKTNDLLLLRNFTWEPESRSNEEVKS